MLAKKASRGKPRHENSNYWMSYSDMMAALLLMFVLLLFLSFNRYVTLQKAKEAELADKETRLTLQAQQLNEAETKLTQRENELATLQIVLDATRTQQAEQALELADKNTAHEMSKAQLEQSLAQLILQQKQIEEQERLLALSQDEIAAARAQLDAQAKDLSDREIRLSASDAELLLEKLRVTDLETLLTAQKEQLETQAKQLDELVGVRSRIIEQLRDAFSRQGLNVAVDAYTGSITMDSTVFFDIDRAVLKEDGRALLTQILPVYFRTLMSPENAEFVAEIIIEGHTDSDGTYEHNLDLSQRRANAVVSFCTSAGFPGLSTTEREQLRSMIFAGGRSETHLIYDAYGGEDKAASRRVEIKFRLRDTEMIANMNRILEGIEP